MGSGKPEGSTSTEYVKSKNKIETKNGQQKTATATTSKNKAKFGEVNPRTMLLDSKMKEKESIYESSIMSTGGEGTVKSTEAI